MTYERNPIAAPRMAGTPLKLFAGLAGSGPGRVVRQQLLRQVGIYELLDAHVTEPPTRPHLTPGPRAMPKAAVPVDLGASAAGLPATQEGFAFESIADFERAYREGRTTPAEVAERVLAATAATEEGDRPLRVFIAQDAQDLRRQAAASAERWARGTPLSFLDGVPVAVKDEVDQVPYPTTVGTRFLGTAPATADAATVERLRAAGALLVGKTNMHEIGIGVTGLNPHHGVCRNPYDPGRHTGGSSSGVGAAVAAGLCPVGLGADGGGSIRMPAAFCGLVGLKSTYGRISEHGAADLAWSVGHLGPLAATARDAAAVWALLAGPDPRDPQTLGQPPVHLEGLDGDVAGLRIGIYRPWFEDAATEVVATCRSMVDRLVERGAVLVDVEIPDLQEAKVAHLVIIASEMLASQLPWYDAHRKDYGLDVQLNLALASEMTARMYVHALRHRNHCARVWTRVMEDVDVVVTPATACVPPPIPERALPGGDSNLPLLDQIMRFAPIPNLNGFPAIAFPAGYDPAGLPIALQVIGRPWEEPLLLRIARVAEGLVERRRPEVCHSLLA